MSRHAKFSILAVLVVALCATRTALVYADRSSSGFILRDELLTVEGTVATSTHFQYYSATGQTVSGASDSTQFIERAGALYYPVATSPVVSATAGNAQVALSWTASTATLANITDYQVGVATSSGGSYTYSSVGVTTSNTVTSLSNGTTYYFKVRVYAGTLLLVESSEVSATPTAPATPPSGGGGGGGGGAAPTTSGQSHVNFSGRAYPRSTVTLLKDARVVASTTAGADARFTITLNTSNTGNFTFSLYSEDYAGRRSSLTSFAVSITAGTTTDIGGIFIAPSIAVDDDSVEHGDNLAILGQSVPGSAITIVVHSTEEHSAQTTSDASGVYLYNFDTTPLELGDHITKSKSAIEGEISEFSASAAFQVVAPGTPEQTPEVTSGHSRGDMNGDTRVNLVDFSIAAYWYGRALTPAAATLDAERLNGDGKFNIIDMSIIAYYWTG